MRSPTATASSSAAPVAWDLEGLPADGPASEHREKLELFGQFVGDWEIVESRYLQPNGEWERSRGEVHWRWILEGRAVQDIWMSYDEDEGRMVSAGTTVRFYDPSIDAWHSVWLSPLQGAVKAFVGRRVGNEIVLEGAREDGVPVRWIFSEITRDSFRWRGEKYNERDSTWSLYEEMHIQRRKPREPGSAR